MSNYTHAELVEFQTHAQYLDYLGYMMDSFNKEMMSKDAEAPNLPKIREYVRKLRQHAKAYEKDVVRRIAEVGREE